MSTKSTSTKTAAATITWGESEWHDAGHFGELNGIGADVYPEDDAWVWGVKPSSARSEYPELYASGTAKTLAGAKSAAAAALRKADKSYGVGSAVEQHELPQMTKLGAELMRAIGRSAFSYFDQGVNEDSGIWHECLSGEWAGQDGAPKTAKGVVGVVARLAELGLLYVEQHDDGEWVALTAEGARVANELAAADKPAPVESVAADVVPLNDPKRGRNGTSKRGKTVTTKTGNPKTDNKPDAEKFSKMVTAAVAAAETTARSTKTRAAKGTQAVVVSRRSRVTGTLVELVNLAHDDSKWQPKGDNKWARVCVDHEHVDYQSTRAAAWNGDGKTGRASQPELWCPKCKRSAAKSK